jgi:hypothetical protein
MPYREEGVVGYREVLRRQLAGDGVRSIARCTGLDPKTDGRLAKIALLSDVKLLNRCILQPLL